MLIYLDSSDCLDLHPNNTPSSFEIEMPDCLIAKEYQGQNGRWFLALVDITVPPILDKMSKWDVIYVMCEQIISSAKGPVYAPIIRQITSGEIKRTNFTRFPSLIHLPVNRTELSKFAIRLTNSRGEIIRCHSTTKAGAISTKCTLDLIWSNLDRQL